MQEHIDILNSLPDRVSQLAVESIVVPRANFMVASILQRNTNEGRNTDGSTRSGYSTKPMYATQQQFVVKGAFKPQGKSGKTKKNGQSNKSMYLPGGYSQLREIQGRRTDIKNYEYFGNLVKSFNLQSLPQQKMVIIGFDSELEAKKRQALEKRDGKAFYPSSDEIKDYADGVTEDSKQLQINLITGVQ